MSVLRRVEVTLIVRADTQEDAKRIVEGRLNSWFLDPTERPADDGPSPTGALLHYRATAVGGHQGIVI